MIDHKAWKVSIAYSCGDGAQALLVSVDDSEQKSKMRIQGRVGRDVEMAGVSNGFSSVYGRQNDELNKIFDKK